MHETELIHEVNLRIREMAGDFAGIGADETQEYLCECGCGSWVSLSIPEFDTIASAGRPVERDGHLAERSREARTAATELGVDAAALRAEARQARHQARVLKAKRPKRQTPPGA